MSLVMSFFVEPQLRRWWAMRPNRLIDRLEKCYADREEFAYALLAEGAQQMEIVLAGKGTVLEDILVEPHVEEGFLVSVEDSLGVYTDE